MPCGMPCPCENRVSYDGGVQDDAVAFSTTIGYSKYGFCQAWPLLCSMQQHNTLQHSALNMVVSSIDEARDRRRRSASGSSGLGGKLGLCVGKAGGAASK